MFYLKTSPENSLDQILNKGGFVWLIGLVLILFSCSEKKEISKPYYPVDSLITAQVTYLKDSKGALTKVASLGEHHDSTTYIPADSIAWANELEVFALLKAINKPVYHGQYTVEDGLPDANSNLKILSFKSAKQLPISSLKIFYQDSHENVRKIEAVYSEMNPLYKSSRTLQLELQDIGHQAVVTSYAVVGGQKMILKDSVRFSLKGTIKIP